MTASAVKKTYTTKILREADGTGLEVPFDPIAVFGKVRAPVKVTLDGYTYRSTIFRMNGRDFLPLAKIHREAAGLAGDETLEVTLELDTGERVVEPPPDLAKALRKAGAWHKWTEMSFTHQREWAEAVADAKKPETRARRIENAVAEIEARPAKPAKPGATSSGAVTKPAATKRAAAMPIAAKRATAKRAVSKRAAAKPAKKARR